MDLGATTPVPILVDRGRMGLRAPGETIHSFTVEENIPPGEPCGPSEISDIPRMARINEPNEYQRVKILT